MDDLSRKYFDDLHSGDADIRYEAFRYLQKETQEPVSWAYEVWDELTGMIRTGNNHERGIGAHLLANLAKSDPEKRMLRDFDLLVRQTHDPKFVTARNTLQLFWKVGIIDREHQDLVTASLLKRYEEAAGDDNITSIRYDILENLRKIFDQFREESIKEKAMELIGRETNLKHQEKFRGLWRRS
ncbi:MAG: hypothetical protein EOO09_01090 [Chitinophagaceae bacterium]|nr:MAG: hypothetical protein EOO09_01090 [Chitinophagaceae bacterium]